VDEGEDGGEGMTFLHFKGLTVKLPYVVAMEFVPDAPAFQGSIGRIYVEFRDGESRSFVVLCNKEEFEKARGEWEKEG